MMKRYLAILIFAILLGCNKHQPEERIIDTTNTVTLTAEEQQFIKDHNVITWALEDNRPPSIYVDDHGNVRGRVPTYLSLISKKTGLVFKPLAVSSLDEALGAVKEGKIDLVVNVRSTPERLEYLGFTAPYTDSVAVFVFQRRGMPNSPLRAGVQKGDAAKDYLEKRFPGISIVETDQQEESLTLLRRGVVDVVILEETSADYFAMKHKTTYHKVKTDFSYQAGFGFKKDNQILGRIMSKVLLTINTADREKINDAWKQENSDDAFTPSESKPACGLF
jgi:ABC-type amino acid transport substrate-binding protein